MNLYFVLLFILNFIIQLKPKWSSRTTKIESRSEKNLHQHSTPGVSCIQMQIQSRTIFHRHRILLKSVGVSRNPVT